MTAPIEPLAIKPQNFPRYNTVLLFGAPGSGKGTQGKILHGIPGFFHSSTGDMFRQLDTESEMGRLFWSYAGAGKLVPDNIVVKAWQQFIKGMALTNKFLPMSQILILDGMPRNVEQAEMLEEIIDVKLVIYLKADLPKMVDRLRGRAVKEKRFDDADETVIQRRLEIYEHETRPVLEYYPAEKIVPIDAMQSQIRVLTQILQAVAPLRDAQDAAHPQG
jgi:adenylate kinase